MDSYRRTSAGRSRVSAWLALVALTLTAHAQSPSAASSYIPFDAARPALQIPSEVPSAARRGAAEWARWVRERDRDIRSRLERGEEDSLANLLIYGTSFTRQPRLTPELMGQFAQEAQRNGAGESAVAQKMETILDGRVTDLVAALANPRGNERLLVMRRLVVKKGLSTAPAGQNALREYLRTNLARVRKEYALHRQEIQALEQSGNSAQAMAERSQMFEARGISLDTSLLPNFALDQTLSELRSRGLLGPHSVRRVAIIGPGLDFADKAEGYDFYPQQTIQPFAIIDSLTRLGLSAPALRVTTFDISARVNQHIARAMERARNGHGYTVQLPRDPARGWSNPATHYWEQFGATIGVTVSPVQPPPALAGMQLRAVKIRPEVVRRLQPVDLNVIYQRLDLPPGERFDLVIATNMFVYYGGFEQALAMLNVGKMLRPGGFLLSNDALPEMPGSSMREAGSTAVVYSERSAVDGDRIIWYQRQR